MKKAGQQKTCGIYPVQLRTIKDIKFGISGTRFFWEKLMTDLNSDGRMEPKNGVFIEFPRGFSAAKFFDKIFAIFTPVGDNFGA
jgi:hypothetical protein